MGRLCPQALPSLFALLLLAASMGAPAAARAETCGVLPFTVGAGVTRGAADNIGSLVSTEADIRGNFELVLSADTSEVGEACGEDNTCITNYARGNRFQKVITGQVKGIGKDRYALSVQLVSGANAHVIREVNLTLDRSPDSLLEEIPLLVVELLTGKRPVVEEEPPERSSGPMFADDDDFGDLVEEEKRPDWMERDRHGRKIRDADADDDPLGLDDLDSDLDEMDLDEMAPGSPADRKKARAKREAADAARKAEEERLAQKAAEERRRRELERMRADEERRAEEHRIRQEEERRNEENYRAQAAQERRERERIERERIEKDRKLEEQRRARLAEEERAEQDRERERSRQREREDDRRRAATSRERQDDRRRAARSRYAKEEEDPGFVMEDEDPGFVMEDEDPGFVVEDEDPGFVMEDEDRAGDNRYKRAHTASRSIERYPYQKEERGGYGRAEPASSRSSGASGGRSYGDGEAVATARPRGGSRSNDRSSSRSYEPEAPVSRRDAYEMDSYDPDDLSSYGAERSGAGGYSGRSGSRSQTSRPEKAGRPGFAIRLQGGFTQYYLSFGKVGLSGTLLVIPNLGIDFDFEVWSFTLIEEDANGEQLRTARGLPAFNIGASYRFLPKKPAFRPYLGGYVGGIHYAQSTIEMADGSTQTKPLFGIQIAVRAGCDFMLTKWFGLNVHLQGGVAYSEQVQEMVHPEWSPVTGFLTAGGGVVFKL